MSHQEDDSLSLPSEENEFQIEVGDRDGYDVLHPKKDSSDEESEAVSFTRTQQPPQFLLLKKKLRSVLGNLYDSNRIEEIAENINNHKRYDRPYPAADGGLYKYIEKQLGSRSEKSESLNKSVSLLGKNSLKEHQNTATSIISTKHSQIYDKSGSEHRKNHY